MKLILTGDLHIKEGLYLQVGLDYIDYLYGYAKSNNIKSIVFLGDLIHKENRIKAETFIPLFKKMEFLKDEGFENYIILGNHDIISTLNNSSLLETFSRFGHLIQTQELVEFGDTKINMCSFTRDAALVPTVNADYLFTHLNITGFDIGGGRISGEEQQAFPVSMFSNYKKVITGHYHKRQNIDNIEYIGSPYQLNFGDTGDYNKGFVVFDTETGNEEFIQYTLAPKFIKYSYDSLWEGLKNNTIKPEDLQNNLVKICVNKKVDALSKLKSLLYNECGVVDIVNEFESPESDNLANDIKIDLNSSVSDMIEEFISKIKINKDGFDINGTQLLERYNKIKGECK